MNSMSREMWLLLVLLVIITALAVTVDYTNASNITSSNTSFNVSSRQMGVVKSWEPAKFLGERDYGSVVRYGPYGNLTSPVKVAYIVGVHPMETRAHQAILLALTNQKSLKHCYYIYQINVTKDRDDYTQGRINGQQLAYDFAIPDVEKGEYNMVVDVHSTKGDYPETKFISVPVPDERSLFLAHSIVNKINWLVFYIPPLDGGPTSGPYVTIPLIRSGTPTMVFENYRYQPFNETLIQAHDFVQVVDNLNF
ncbi:hypothetical protein [Methanobacterium ferruginis]|uniref:hypothetical protein n=1 Tax=Methanobacterium ferruginis TaxID=710191 RepID=UPI0025723C31|nr:hypothetical protein [Methanobacterium ferruginis]